MSTQNFDRAARTIINDWSLTQDSDRAEAEVPQQRRIRSIDFDWVVRMALWGTGAVALASLGFSL